MLINVRAGGFFFLCAFLFVTVVSRFIYWCLVPFPPGIVPVFSAGPFKFDSELWVPCFLRDRFFDYWTGTEMFFNGSPMFFAGFASVVPALPPPFSGSQSF